MQETQKKGHSSPYPLSPAATLREVSTSASSARLRWLTCAFSGYALPCQVWRTPHNCTSRTQSLASRGRYHLGALTFHSSPFTRSPAAEFRGQRPGKHCRKLPYAHSIPIRGRQEATTGSRSGVNADNGNKFVMICMRRVIVGHDTPLMGYATDRRGA